MPASKQIELWIERDKNRFKTTMSQPNDNKPEQVESYQPKGNYFVFRGIRLIHVTEGHAKNWICYQHPDGQWVTLYHIPDEADELRQKLAEAKKENENLLTAISIYKSGNEQIAKDLTDLRAELAKNQAAREWIEYHSANVERILSLYGWAGEADVLSELRALVQSEGKK